jgi:hypothetical protein
MYFIQHCFICRPSDSTVWTVATLALAVRRSPTTRLDLVHNSAICGIIALLKKENQIFLTFKEIQSGAVAKSYMRKDFLIYEEMRKYFPIYEEAVSHIPV